MTEKVILITGAGSGIGAELAKKFSSPGVTLGLLGRDRAKLEHVAGSCRIRGALVITDSVDVTDAQTLHNWISSFDSDHPVDLLVANAGITSSIGPNGEPECWEVASRVIKTNLLGMMASIHPLLDAMRKRNRGQIALVSSLAAFRGMAITPAYCASKAGVKAYGEALRGWLSADGIQVSVICPGFVKSPMSDQFPGAKPLLISAERAAAIIQRGLEKNKPCISFPFPLNLGTWLLSVMPSGLADSLLGFFSYGARRKR